MAAVSLFLLAQNVTCTWENPFVLYAEGSALAIYILHPALRNLAQRQLLPVVGCARHGGRLAVAGTDLGAGAAGCGNLVVA